MQLNATNVYFTRKDTLSLLAVFPVDAYLAETNTGSNGTRVVGAIRALKYRTLPDDTVYVFLGFTILTPGTPVLRLNLKRLVGPTL